MKEVHEPHGANLVFGPIAERVFRALLGTVMSVPGSTFVDAMELLADPGRWREYEPHIRLRSVRTYWEQWLRTSSNQDGEQLPYLASKLSPMVDNVVVRRLIDQRRSTFSFHDVLERGGIVIVVLDRSSTGPVAAGFITRMLLHHLMRAVMQRGPASPTSRPVSLYIDEVQNVAGPVIEAVLAEGRKWGLSAVLANQHAAQLPDSLVHAIAGNVGTVVSYGVSVRDAPMMARMLGGDMALAEALSRLPNYRAVVGASPGGEPQPPFLLEGPDPPAGCSPERLEQVRRASRANHGGVVRDRERDPDEGPRAARQLALFEDL
ncbi:MAG: type IV secretory system conjugative DNA transfer family protein [Chloroflexota bacterium]